MFPAFHNLNHAKEDVSAAGSNLNRCYPGAPNDVVLVDQRQFMTPPVHGRGSQSSSAETQDGPCPANIEESEAVMDNGPPRSLRRRQEDPMLKNLAGRKDRIAEKQRALEASIVQIKALLAQVDSTHSRAEREKILQVLRQMFAKTSDLIAENFRDIESLRRAFKILSTSQGACVLIISDDEDEGSENES
ncbi:hypothetical protein B0H14DRAFT_2563671 [Mycena olivaceomarginata]|nr:hypothetical protein B0H14DRAFT_2563671 [Mycena olivaceomarginata]